jgi:diguanylate cyclase (GGDEF)-like protein/putative nucleotidyltransferase with HDIG domain
MGQSRRHIGRGALLLPLAYAASISLLGLSAATLAVLDVNHATDGGIAASVSADQAIVREFGVAHLTAAEVRSGTIAEARRAEVQSALADLARIHGYVGIGLLASDGTVLAEATDGPGPGALRFDSAPVQAALSPAAAPVIVDGPTTAGLAGPPVLLEPFRFQLADEAGLILVVQRDATPILAGGNATWPQVAALALSAGFVLTILLYALYGAASTRIRRQESGLAEARRRDPLTGLLNHAAIVTTLTELLEASRADGRSVGIALVDVDNFRLLNDVHGSSAGDEVLLRVARTLRQESGEWAALARYGPDEFLAIAVGPAARQLETALKRARTVLDGLSLDLDGEERLPITVSVGITFFPFHAASVIELLSAATVAIGEARSAGGNRIEIADAWTTEPKAPHTTFDVLQGLVLAIDRKDHYTKLHSEDVACYALFLAQQIGLDADLIVALRMAGLLHDVGKIGIPDDVLRKPGRLTPYEYEVVKHHVTLGDLIVRDLPDIEVVRAGVRHHHERWDGTGYVDGLKGEQIPLIARILAVADAFSAMTTSRPYRKALSVEQALEELLVAGGTQLDRHLVAAFVTGMESSPEAPLPGADRNPAVLWTPGVAA